MIYLTLFAKSDKTRLFEKAFTFPRLKLQKLAVMETLLISFLIWRLLGVSSFVTKILWTLRVSIALVGSDWPQEE